ncbi:WXG100 family type VII secretion target [Saccharopolyspora soli]|uniref:WXG100 family type VII secretion target n=1 Tax=Saccharopolyspora soli TaxID=2926618 RepID=UPI001F5A488F|nr:WXG100 family type VII secretion target [Saccharopolyspora soli]
MARNSSEVAEHLDYLSRIADELEVAHSIPADLADLVGHHEDLREAAQVWRKGADTAEQAAGDVQGRLGGIDSVWQGADADAFLAHIQEVGLAGNDLVDSMRALADALEHTVDAVQAQLDDLGELVAEAADSVSAALVAPVEGATRARKHLADLAQPARELAGSILDTYRAFTRFCDDLEAGRSTGSVQFDRRMPTQTWDFSAPTAAAPPAAAEPAGAAPAGAGGGAAGGAAGVGAAGASSEPGGDAELAPGGTSRAAEPSALPPAAAAAAGGGAVAGGAAAAGMSGGMMPMGMMGGMMGGAQQGGQERRNQSRLKSKPEELFGTPPDAAPAVFGAKPEGQAPEPAKPTQPQAARPALGIPSVVEPAKPRPSIDDALHPKPTTPPVADTPPSKPKTGTASVGDAPPPKPRN